MPGRSTLDAGLDPWGASKQCCHQLQHGSR